MEENDIDIDNDIYDNDIYNDNDSNSNDDFIYSYLISQIKDKFVPNKEPIKKLYDIFENQELLNLLNLDQIMIYMVDHEEKGVLDYLINKIYMNPKFVDNSFFYLYHFISMLTYKKNKSSIKKYIMDIALIYIKYRLRIFLFLNYFPKNIKEIENIKFEIKDILDSYHDINDSILILNQKSKKDFFIENHFKQRNKMNEVDYFYKCIDFFENIKKLCLLLYKYPLNIEDNKKKMTRNTALRKFITLINEEIDFIRGEEYKKMKNEKLLNNKLKEKSFQFIKSKYNKGYLLPFNNNRTNSDENSLIIVNILPEYSTVLNSREKVSIKLACECIEYSETETETFFELYDNNNFFNKYDNKKEDKKIDNKSADDNLNNIINKELSFYNPGTIKLFDKWKNLEKSIILSNEEMHKKDENKTIDKMMKETNHVEFDDFVVLDFDIDQINPFGEPKEKTFEKIYKTSSFKKFRTYRVKCFIAKVNENLLQEMFVLQIIKKFEEIFKKNNIFVKSYEYIITSESSGLIEYLNNTNSIDGILKKIPKEWDLNKFYRTYFKGNELKRAQMSFAESLAGFCLLSYYLDIKDRHNGNILIDNKGHIMHINFDFLLGTSPKNLGFERAQFKLVKSYIDILDGLEGNMFKYFKMQMVKGLIESKKYFEIIRYYIKIMSHFNLPCLEGQNVDEVIKGLHKKFLFEYSKEQIEKYVDEMIYNNYENFWTKKYDQFQYWTNGILY